MKFRQLIQPHDIVILPYNPHDNKHNNTVVMANMIETKKLTNIHTSREADFYESASLSYMEKNIILHTSSLSR